MRRQVQMHVQLMKLQLHMTSFPWVQGRVVVMACYPRQQVEILCAVDETAAAYDFFFLGGGMM
jgi:hypothetical protein